MKKFNLVLSAMIVFSSMQVWAGAYDELTGDQQASLRRGEQVTITQDVASSSWPKITVYQPIKATTEEVTAVFTDYELHRSFIPGLSKSKISKRYNPRDVEIDYTLKIPVVSDESYTVRNKLSSYGNGASYRVDWTLVRADTTKDTVGNVRMERMGDQTLMAYYNFVIPGSGMADLVRNQALKQVKDTAKAIAQQVNYERANNQAQLQRQVKALQDALAAE